MKYCIKCGKKLKEITNDRFMFKYCKKCKVYFPTDFLVYPRNNQLKKQILSELKFLNCQGVKACVRRADFGACKNPCPTIENRKNKLKKMLKELNAQDKGDEQ